jgi:Reverse transcriptase (RNA-dependent DNA polymerase)
MEIPGVDYTEKFASVATSTTNHMVVAVALYQMDDKEAIESIDVEAAFLNSDIPKDMVVYLEWPEGLENYGIITPEDRIKSVAQLMMPMYGKVDVPKMWKETLKKHLQDCGVKESKIDPCLYYMRDDKGKVILLAAMTVDDILIAGTAQARLEFKKILKTRFMIMELSPLQKHLGVYYTKKTDDQGDPYYEMRLPHMVKSIVEQYEKSEFGLKHQLSDKTVPATASSVLPKMKKTKSSIRRHFDRLLERLCMLLAKSH